MPTDREIVDRWRSEPAPLLPMLHAFHDRDGYLSEAALREVSRKLRIPLAVLYGTVTAYHHFSRAPDGREAPRVCVGPICRERGGQKLLEELQADGAKPMPCAGRCDDPVPVVRGSRVLNGTSASGIECRPSPLPRPSPGGSTFEECVFRAIREPGRSGIGGYQRTGGYEALTRAVRENQPPEIIGVLAASGLVGRGGAGFPTAAKWKAVAQARNGPKTIVCNADEGEPGSFKDRALLDHDPHAIIEGMLLAAYATGATRGFIYLRYEYVETFRILERAISEAEDACFLGEDILGRFPFRLYLRRGAGAYICGEEGALLNSLEGRHPFVRNRPPFPVTHGFESLPTVVNNVETLASVPPIVRRGADWYRNLGMGTHVGAKVISLSGDVQQPGNYEVPVGFPLKTLIQRAGGPPAGRSVQAVTMAGLSGGFLAAQDLDVTLDESSIRDKGSFLGTGGIMVLDDSRDVIDVARAAMEFFADESCGKCFPCRVGTQRLSERLAGQAGPKELGAWLEEVRDVAETMKAASACGLGTAAPLIAESLVRYFPKQVARLVAS